MNIIQELRQRRVPQIVSAYVVGSWGALQFLAFLQRARCSLAYLEQMKNQPATSPLPTAASNH